MNRLIQYLYLIKVPKNSLNHIFFFHFSEGYLYLTCKISPLVGLDDFLSEISSTLSGIFLLALCLSFFS